MPYAPPAYQANKNDDRKVKQAQNEIDRAANAEVVFSKYHWLSNAVNIAIANTIYFTQEPKIVTMSGQQVPIYEVKFILENQPFYDASGRKIGSENVALIVSHFYKQEQKGAEGRLQQFFWSYASLPNQGACTIAFDMASWKRDNSYTNKQTGEVVPNQSFSAISILSRSSYEYALLQQVTELQTKLNEAKTALIPANDDTTSLPYDEPF